jgi:hypothetical protein
MKRTLKPRPANRREIERELERCDFFESEGRMMMAPLLQVSVYRQMLRLYAEAKGYDLREKAK